MGRSYFSSSFVFFLVCFFFLYYLKTHVRTRAYRYRVTPNRREFYADIEIKQIFMGFFKRQFFVRQYTWEANKKPR